MLDASNYKGEIDQIKNCSASIPRYALYLAGVGQGKSRTKISEILIFLHNFYNNPFSLERQEEFERNLYEGNIEQAKSISQSGSTLSKGRNPGQFSGQNQFQSGFAGGCLPKNVPLSKIEIVPPNLSACKPSPELPSNLSAIPSQQSKELLKAIPFSQISNGNQGQINSQRQPSITPPNIISIQEPSRPNIPPSNLPPDIKSIDPTSNTPPPADPRQKSSPFIIPREELNSRPNIPPSNLPPDIKSIDPTSNTYPQADPRQKSSPFMIPREKLNPPTFHDQNQPLPILNPPVRIQDPKFTPPSASNQPILPPSILDPGISRQSMPRNTIPFANPPIVPSPNVQPHGIPNIISHRPPQPSFSWNNSKGHPVPPLSSAMAGMNTSSNLQDLARNPGDLRSSIGIPSNHQANVLEKPKNTQPNLNPDRNPQDDKILHSTAEIEARAVDLINKFRANEPPSAENMCELCREKINRSVLFKINRCKHGYHSLCMIDFVKKLLDRNESQLQCPANDCQNEISLDELRKLSPELESKYNEILFMKFMQNEPSTQDPKQRCPNCRREIKGSQCTHCKKCERCGLLSTLCNCRQEAIDLVCPQCNYWNSSYHQYKECDSCKMIICFYCQKLDCSCH